MLEQAVDGATMLLDDGERVDLSAVGDVAGARWQDAELAARNLVFDRELVGSWSGLLGFEGHLIPVRTSGGVKDSAGKDTKLAVVWS